MNCPYAVNRTVMSKTSFQYDDSGNQTEQTTAETNTAIFTKCKEKECGAWSDNGCNYKG